MTTAFDTFSAGAGSGSAKVFVFASVQLGKGRKWKSG